jgi:hypothetical protein
MGKFLVTYGIEASLDISNTSTADYQPFGEGFENLSEALNEVVYSSYYLSNEGFGNSEVTGMQPVFSLTGKRIIGDAVQDYIFAPERKYGLGEKRKSKLKVEVLNDDGTKKTVITVGVTIANIVEYGGNTTDGSGISCELRFNGKPTVTTETVSA